MQIKLAFSKNISKMIDIDSKAESIKNNDFKCAMPRLPKQNSKLQHDLYRLYVALDYVLCKARQVA